MKEIFEDLNSEYITYSGLPGRIAGMQRDEHRIWSSTTKPTACPVNTNAKKPGVFAPGFFYSVLRRDSFF
jgi:hypothetical protein